MELLYFKSHHFCSLLRIKKTESAARPFSASTTQPQWPLHGLCLCTQAPLKTFLYQYPQSLRDEGNIIRCSLVQVGRKPHFYSLQDFHLLPDYIIHFVHCTNEIRYSNPYRHEETEFGTMVLSMHLKLYKIILQISLKMIKSTIYLKNMDPSNLHVDKSTLLMNKLHIGLPLTKM